MIEKQEILTISNRLSLDPSTVEKDYVIGWVLRGIYCHPKIQNVWIFKGGTAIKKCYFDDYRFSEDLDFSLLNTHRHNLPDFKTILFEIADWIYEQSGIEVPQTDIKMEIFKTPNGLDAIQAKITYNGPLKRKTNFPRIKLDLTLQERIVLEPEKRLIFHTYSDNPHDEIQARCYPYEELFAEKIRALLERTRPRDVYDVIHLYKSREKIKNKQLFFHALEEKCRFKGIPLPNLQALQDRLNIQNLNSEWEKMLAHQLPKLDSFEESWAFMTDIFEWIYQDVEQYSTP